MSLSGVCTNLRLKAMQRQIDSASPGPSAHVPLLGLVQAKAPSVRIGTAARSPGGGWGDAPGPADYQDPLRMSTVRGAHVEDSRLRAVQGAVIGTSPRGSPTGRAGGEGGPGPADYSYALPRSPGVAFGRDRRDHGGEGGEGVPGPGAHTVSTGFTREASPRQPMGTAQRFPPPAAEGAPGPGQYQAHLVDSITGKSVSSARPQSARALIGTAARPSLAGGSLSPGPAYSPSTRHTLPSSPGYSVGRAPRAGSAAASDSPGPGRYAAEQHDAATRPASPRQPMGSSPRFPAPPSPDAGEVGPGAYQVQLRARLPGGVIGTAARPDLAGPRLGEGPGVAYAHTGAGAAVRPRSASTVFGQSRRFGAGDGGAGDAPSPASYHASLAATLPSPSRTLIGRAARGDGGSGRGEGSPGPGAYAVERTDALGAMSASSTRVNAPRQRIGSAARGGSAGGSASPGPAYSPNTAYVLPRSAGFAMPRSPRDAGWKGGEGPGPSDYGAADGGGAVLPSSPHVRIGTAARFPEGSDRDAPLPGPGAYVVQGHNYVAGGTLTRSQRPALSTSPSGPGPGAYALPASPAGGVSFTRDPRFHGGEGEGAPGPGAHDTAPGFSYLLPQSPRSVMGRAPRSASGEGAGGDTAGVPLYSTAGAVAATRPASPRQPIGSAARFSPSRGDASPGPGAFLGLADAKRGPSFTIRGER